MSSPSGSGRIPLLVTPSPYPELPLGVDRKPHTRFPLLSFKLSNQVVSPSTKEDLSPALAYPIKCVFILCL